MWDQYLALLYLSGQVMQAVSYGDLVPYAMSEQIWIIVFAIATSVNRTFLLVSMAHYLGVMDNPKIVKIAKRNQLYNWMVAHNLPLEYMSKIREFSAKKRHSKDLFEGSEILYQLPKNLHREIKTHLDKVSKHLKPFGDSFRKFAIRNRFKVKIDAGSASL